MLERNVSPHSLPALCILPGWEGSRETWNDFVIEARPYFSSVHVIELPCFGTTPCPETVWGVEEYAAYAREKIRELAAGPVILFGHSFGGAVATVIAAEEKSLIHKLVLSGAAIYRPRRPFRRLFFGFFAKLGSILFRLPVLRRYTTLARNRFYQAIGSPDTLSATGMKQAIYQKIIRQDVSQHLERISVPTLVIWGSKDKHAPLRFGKKIAQKILDAKLHIIPGASHGLHLKAKKELLAALIEFTQE